MSFSDHKITQFTHRISELADQPNMPADELKARFDACPEQLRVSLNAVCDEAAALDSKVGSIIAKTFDGVIEKSMLSDELQDEIAAKSEEASVAERLATEATARESADSALSTRVSSLENQVPQRAQIYFLSYTGTQGDRTFTLSFVPKMVIVSCHDYSDTVPTAPVAVAQGQTVYYSKNEVASLSGTILRLTAYGGHNTLNKSYAILALA